MTRVVASPPWLVAIPAGTWQLSGIKSAQALGFKVLGIDADPSAAGRDVCDLFLACDIGDTAAQLERIQKEELPVSVVISFCSDAGILPAARLRAALGIPGTTVEVARNLTDKERQRKCYREGDVPSVRYDVFDDPAAAALLLLGQPSRVVVKPVDGAGSRGVSVVEPHPSAKRAQEAVDIARSYSPTGRILVEEFIEGTEYTVELAGCSGVWSTLAVTEKTKAPGSRTVSDGLSAIDLDSERARLLALCATMAASSLSIDGGIVHAEVMWHPTRGPVMIELAGRGGGFMLNDGLVPLISGADPSELAIRTAIDPAAPLPISTNRPGALVFLPSGTGTITQISMPDPDDFPPGVRVEPLMRVGDTVTYLVGDGQRVAYALVTASNFGEALPLGRSVLSRVAVKYD